MPPLPLADWDPSLFGELKLLLHRAVNQPTTSTLRRLDGKLRQAQPWLLHLTQLPPANDADRQHVEKNPIVLPTGTSVEVKGDLLTTTTIISDALSLSQLLAAVLALQSEGQRPHYPTQSIPEIAVYLLHHWTAELLELLRELLRVAFVPEDDLPVHLEPLRSFVEELLNTKVSLGAGKGDGTLVDQITVQLDVLQGKIDGLVRSNVPAGGHELHKFRIEGLRAEQNRMAGILALIAEGGHLGRGQVIRVLKWLKKCERTDGMVGMVVAAVFAAVKSLDGMDHADPRWSVADDWCHDIKFLKLASSLVLQEQWVAPRLREAVKLAWALFYLSCVKHVSSVVQTGLDAHEMEQWLYDAVNGEAFQFLHDLVLGIRQDRGWEEPDQTRLAVLSNEFVKAATASDPVNDSFVFTQVQDLVDLVGGRKPFLRNLRNKEEDLAMRRSHSSPPPANYQAFLRLVAIVYKSLPANSAQHLWSNSNFLSTVLDARGGFPGPAFWEMLAAISVGPSCAVQAYETLKGTRLPWTALLKFYAHYTDIMPHIYEPGKPTQAASLDPMPHDEVEICIGWTRVLIAVVRGSLVAKGALLHQKFIPALFAFINCDNLPVQLKAALLDAVTAFCERTGDGAADSEALGQAVDGFKAITFRDPDLDTRHLEGARIPPPVGWLAKMEYSESDANSYCLSRAYVNFLTALLPTPSSVHAPLPLRLLNVLRRGTFHVLDGILLSLKIRRYSRESEKWEVLETLAEFLEKALLDFNMEELLSQGSTRAIGPIAVELSEEPGFVVMLRLLSDANVFAVLSSVLDSAAAERAPRPAIVNKVLLHLLRIYHRVHEVQLVFADVLLLTLADPTRNPSHPFKRPYGLQPLDNHLLAHLSNINTIALLVGDTDPAIAYISTKIVSALSQSPVFNRSDMFRGEYSSSVNRLAGIIDASDDSIRIARGFMERLEADDVDVEDMGLVEDKALHGDIQEVAAALPMVTRSVILDILVEGTTPDITTPNIAHFLLGYDFRHRDFTLAQSDSCLHTVLFQLLDGVELFGTEGEDTLIDLHPTLAAKSAALVYQLFAHPLTGRATMSFAMSIAGYSARQLISLPRKCPTWEPPTGVAITPAIQVATTAETLVAFLQFQRWILSGSALEAFTFEGHGAHATHMARTLFQGGSGEEDEEDDEEATERQKAPLLIDLLSSLDVEWKEPEPENRQLEFYSGFDFDQFKHADQESWDLPGLSRGMQAYRRQLERQGAVSATPETANALDAETAYVAARLGAKNRETEVAIAKGEFLIAWNEMLKVALTLLFQHVAEDQQEAILFDILEALLQRLDSDLAPGVLVLVCESVLVATTSLVNLLAKFDGVNLPLDQLSSTLARVVDAAVRPGSTETARGNLYAAITQFLQLVTPTISIPDDHSVLSVETAGGAGAHSVRRVTLQVLAQKKERLLPILCRDAMDDRDVWKTECFALLGGIVAVCQSDRDRHIFSPLTQNGYLPLFVRSIKERENALQECLSPDPENLHAYWVFEAKVAFLISLASTRKGSEDLLDAGVFEIFATCGFINVETSEEIMDEAAANEIVSRQHRVLLCSLQLLVRVLSSLHKSSRSGAGHAISFLNAHRESVLGLLRESQQLPTEHGLEECRLVVSILAMVVHKVPATDLHSPSSFGAFHMAVLSAAAQSFDKNTWVEIVEEDAKFESHIALFNQVLLAYLSAATAGLKAGSGSPVFITGAQRNHGAAAKYIASAPSLQTAVNLLADLADAVQDVSGQYEMILERVQEGGYLDEGDIVKLRNEFIGDEPLSDDLIKSAFVVRSQTLFNMIESLLLLIWRHLLFYANDSRGSLEPVRPDNLSASLGSFMASQANMEASRSSAGTMRMLERVAASLKGTLERLDDLDVSIDLRSANTGGNGDAYYGMLVRRLKELTAGLSGAVAEQE
ncbi:hypothetical protein IAT38_001649 [Cryptococcus sp. DSM 104549]